MRMDEFVEEKEPEWIKQRTREKRLARKLQQEQERIRQLEEEAKEKKRLAEEKEREQAAIVRRHLRMHSVARRGRRHSDDSSEMSSVPSDVSSPSPPPPQIFHEVQESVPFPFGPASTPPSQKPPAVTSFDGPDVMRSGANVSATSAKPIKALPRLKIKFKGASISVDKQVDQVRQERLASHTATPVTAESWATIIQSKSPRGQDAALKGKETLTSPGSSIARLQHKCEAPTSTTVANSNAVLSSSTRSAIEVGTQIKTISTLDSARSPDETRPSGMGEQLPAPAIPPATEQVISRMEVTITEGDAVDLPKRDGANVETAIDLTDEADLASSSSNVLGTTLGLPQSLTVRTEPSASDSHKQYQSQRVLEIIDLEQDEEDEAMVEELGGLDVLSHSDSSVKGSARLDCDFPPSSAGSLSRGVFPDRFPDVTLEASSVCKYKASRQEPTGSRLTIASVAITAAASGSQQANTSSTIVSSRSVETPDPVDPGLEMIIDDELEPVPMRDTHCESWKQVLRSARAASMWSGSERSFLNKGKGKANELSVRVHSPDNDDADERSRWDHSAKVIQVQGITGPTATDTDRSSIDSPDTTSISTPLVPSPIVAPATVQVVTIDSVATTGPSSSTPVSSASLERRRQNETLYAALAANFLTRCGSTTQARSLYDSKVSVQPKRPLQPIWQNTSESESRSSGTPPAFSLLGQCDSVTTCDPRDVFGGTGVKKEPDETEIEKFDGPEGDPREPLEERLSDDETITTRYVAARSTTPLEPSQELVVPQNVADGSLTSPYEVNSEDESELQREFSCSICAIDR